MPVSSMPKLLSHCGSVVAEGLVLGLSLDKRLVADKELNSVWLVFCWRLQLIARSVSTADFTAMDGQRRCACREGVYAEVCVQRRCVHSWIHHFSPLLSVCSVFTHAQRDLGLESGSEQHVTFSHILLSGYWWIWFERWALNPFSRFYIAWF